MSTLATTDRSPGGSTRAWSGRRRWPLVEHHRRRCSPPPSCCCRWPSWWWRPSSRAGARSQRLLFRHTVAVLLWNTVRLTRRLHALCALLGVGAAWCVERTDLPGAAPVGGRARAAAGDPRLRRGLRLGLARARAARLPGGGDDHDAVALPARLPAGGRRAGRTSTPASRRPRAASASGPGGRSGA